MAFSSWRLAVISEGVYARYLHGQMGDQVDAEVIETFKVGTEQLAEAALEAIGRRRPLTRRRHASRSHTPVGYEHGSECTRLPRPQGRPVEAAAADRGPDPRAPADGRLRRLLHRRADAGRRRRPRPCRASPSTCSTSTCATASPVPCSPTMPPRPTASSPRRAGRSSGSSSPERHDRRLHGRPAASLAYCWAVL